MSAASEAHVEVLGRRVWVRRSGGGRGAPLVVLHGGPGCPSDYLFALEALGDAREVVLFDQPGCGRSEPIPARDCTLAYFVASLAALLDALGLARCALFGHSWGGMLATDYALAHPARVHRLIFASACLGMQRTRDDMARLRATLPPGVRAMLDRHEAAGTTESAGYQTAALAFYRRHLCRLDPWPAAMTASQHGIARDVYRTLWGPSELTPTGSLRDYERAHRLGELVAPALFVCGRHDEITPEATAAYAAATPGARLCIFEDSAHVAHLEEPARFFDVVHGFLAEGDA